MTDHSTLNSASINVKPSIRARIFEWVLLSSLAFVLLTALSMAFYPGGTQTQPNHAGYVFSLNFFSDLGRTRSYNGVPNRFSAPLFALALGVAGLALMGFFAAFSTLFWHGLWPRVMALWGALMGTLAGACFIGVAAVPANINSSQHGLFVFWAFRAFLGAVVPFALLIFAQKNYPHSGAWIFVLFTLFLAAYIALITVGPSSKSPDGLFIQVVGQKIIVYASVASVSWQAILARQFLRVQQK